jgi:hypothetical protein
MPGPQAGTLAMLIEAYRASPDYAQKGERTKRLNERHMRLILSAWGALKVKGLKPRHVLELRDSLADRPGMADQVVCLLSAIIGWVFRETSPRSIPVGRSRSCPIATAMRRGAGLRLAAA